MKTAKKILEDRFAKVQYKKLVIFHSPKDCSKISYERVNPDHVAIIWGVRKKSENKGCTQIKLGEMFFCGTTMMLMTNIYLVLLGKYPLLLETIGCIIIYGAVTLLPILWKQLLMESLASRSSSVQ